jgi:hypothetical protein
LGVYESCHSKVSTPANGRRNEQGVVHSARRHLVPSLLSVLAPIEGFTGANFAVRAFDFGQDRQKMLISRKISVVHLEKVASIFG